MITTLFVLLIGFFVTGALLSFFFQNKKYLANRFSNGFAIAGSITGIILGIITLLSPVVINLAFATTLPLFYLSLRFDMLAGYFMLLTGTIGLASAVFGLGFMQRYFKTYNVGAFGFFYNLFILSFFLVITASNGLYFLFAWEIMTLASFFLVVFKRSKYEEVISAGSLYFIMTHIGTVCLFSAFFLLYGATGTFEFSGIAKAAATIPGYIKDAVFLLLFIGFGIKAGIIPFHIWLPKAHSASPSNVSALMSGVMIKMGIFMLFRFFLDILPGGPLWWGIVVLAIGAISALLGVLYALSEHDLKRLLACHSIENIGIILLGLGSSMIFVSLNMPQAAIIAAVAGLFHTFNHALFKSLLFFGASSVIAATGTRNMELYGGLIKTMPYTALFFLVGAIAISGLPPFNGFASEWLTFQSLFLGINNHGALIANLFIFAVIALALTGGLAAACFVKAVGIMFLARPRSIASEKAKESSWLQLVPMGYLALLCLVFGLGAGSIVTLLKRVVYQLAGFMPSGSLISTPKAIILGKGFAELSIPALVFGILAVFLVGYMLTRLISRKTKIVRDVTWDCGYTGLLPQMEITATGFSTSLVTIFKGLFQPAQDNEIEYINEESHYFIEEHTVNFKTKNIFELYLHKPLREFTQAITGKITHIQGGSVNLYVLYMFLTVIGLIIWVKYS